MNIDLTQIALAVIALIGTVLTGFVIPLLKSKLTQNQQETLEAVIQTGVYAAEQLFKKPSSGAEKLQYVKDYLAKLGYDVDTEAIRAAIEAEVKMLSIFETNH